jgi:type IV pilus assembly protein PilB
MAFDAARLMQSSGIVKEVDLARAREVQVRQGGSLPRICHELGILDEARWARVISKALALPVIELNAVEVEPGARGKAPDLLLRELIAFPFRFRDDGRTLEVAMAEPQDDVGRAQLKAATGCELKIGVAGYRAILEGLARHPHPDSLPEIISQLPFDGRVSGSERAQMLSPEQVKRLEALVQAGGRNARALRAAIDFCIERRVFTADELRLRLQDKNRSETSAG